MEKRSKVGVAIISNAAHSGKNGVAGHHVGTGYAQSAINELIDKKRPGLLENDPKHKAKFDALKKEYPNKGEEYLDKYSELERNIRKGVVKEGGNIMTDLELMQLLDEQGYEATLENLQVLKEGLESGEYEIKNVATIEKKPSELTSDIDNEDVYDDEEHEQKEDVGEVVVESFSDYELYQLLESEGYETTNENLEILKEGLYNGEIEILNEMRREVKEFLKTEDGKDLKDDTLGSRVHAVVNIESANNNLERRAVNKVVGNTGKDPRFKRAQEVAAKTPLPERERETDKLAKKKPNSTIVKLYKKKIKELSSK